MVEIANINVEEIENGVELGDILAHREKVKERATINATSKKPWQKKKDEKKKLVKSKKAKQKQEIINIARTKEIPPTRILEKKFNKNSSKQETALTHEVKTYSDEIRYTQLKKKCKECLDSWEGIECFSCSTREEILKLDPCDPDHSRCKDINDCLIG